MGLQDLNLESIEVMNESGWVYLRYTNLNRFEKKLIHGITTRLGGVSKGDEGSFNLGFLTADDPENVSKNYHILAKGLGINVKDIVYSRQVHGNCVRLVTQAETHLELPCIGDRPSYDAMITATPGILLMAFYADCVPVYFYDPVEGIVGIAHSGWKGTLGRISQKTVSAMQQHFGSKPENLHVSIGPSIGSCCFEVGFEVLEAFEKEFGTQLFESVRAKHPLHLDLWRIIRKNLQESGVLQEKIFSSEVCTKCQNDLFFSHRGQKGKTGRLGGFIGLKG